jgi:Ca2+/Na+ antiporter
LIEGKKSASLEKSGTYDKKEIPSNILFFILGTASIIFGAEFLVSSGKTIAAGFGISEAIIGFTVIALGTSLPEFVTTLTAIRKKENSLSVGNIVGANIIDTTLILPLCAVINGQALPVEKINLVFAQISTPMLEKLVHFCRKNRKRRHRCGVRDAVSGVVYSLMRMMSLA